MSIQPELRQDVVTPLEKLAAETHRVYFEKGISAALQHMNANIRDKKLSRGEGSAYGFIVSRMITGDRWKK